MDSDYAREMDERLFAFQKRMEQELKAREGERKKEMKRVAQFRKRVPDTFSFSQLINMNAPEGVLNLAVEMGMHPDCSKKLRPQEIVELIEISRDMCGIRQRRAGRYSPEALQKYSQAYLPGKTLQRYGIPPKLLKRREAERRGIKTMEYGNETAFSVLDVLDFMDNGSAPDIEVKTGIDREGAFLLIDLDAAGVEPSGKYPYRNTISPTRKKKVTGPKYSGGVAMAGPRKGFTVEEVSKLIGEPEEDVKEYIDGGIIAVQRNGLVNVNKLKEYARDHPDEDIGRSIMKKIEACRPGAYKL